MKKAHINITLDCAATEAITRQSSLTQPNCHFRGVESHHRCTVVEDSIVAPNDQLVFSRCASFVCPPSIIQLAAETGTRVSSMPK
jgi:hypothetical protein